MGTGEGKLRGEPDEGGGLMTATQLLNRLPYHVVEGLMGREAADAVECAVRTLAALELLDDLASGTDDPEWRIEAVEDAPCDLGLACPCGYTADECETRPMDMPGCKLPQWRVVTASAFGPIVADPSAALIAWAAEQPGGGA